MTRSSQLDRRRSAAASREEEPAPEDAAVPGDAPVPEDAPTVFDLLRPLTGPAIACAAARVAQDVGGEFQLSADDLTRHLVWLAGACTDARPDEDANGSVTALRRRLVDSIRRQLVVQWGVEIPPPDQMLDALQQLERAQFACTPTPDQSFAAELTDRGGFDLVVEIAHDMRSPLTSILFLSEILHRGHSGAFNEVQKRQIGIVYGAALGLVGMASDLIEMAKGGNRLAPSQPGPFSVNEMLTGVLDLVRPTAEEKRLEVRVAKLHSEHRIGHPIPISRVLLNLTTNALKFTHSGRVELSAESVSGSVVRFAVRDTGAGIEPEAMATLYQSFRREPLRESGYCFSGTGLGLAICRRLVKAMGSELHVYTRPGWGTRFYFEVDLPPASSL